MSSLSSENRTSDGEVVGRSDVLSSSEVGRYSSSFNHLRKSKEALDAVVGELVGASRDRSSSSGGESSTEQGDVLSLAEKGRREARRRGRSDSKEQRDR